MGAEQFTTSARGKDADEAFHRAVDDARYEYGHGGYTGTIAEKKGFKLFPVPEGMTPRQVMQIAMWECQVPEEFKRHQMLLGEIIKTVDDKWGPAACLQVGEGEYVFFGLASS